MDLIVLLVVHMVVELINLKKWNIYPICIYNSKNNTEKFLKKDYNFQEEANSNGTN